MAVCPVALATTLLFFLMSCYLVSLSLSGVYQFELTASGTQSDFWRLFYSVNSRKPVFSEKRASLLRQLPTGDKRRLAFFQNNHPVSWLRIDPGNHPGTVRLYKLVVKRRLNDDIIFSAEDIYSTFQVGHAGMSMQLGDGFVEITSERDDPYLVSRTPMLHENSLGFKVLPLVLFSFYLYQWLKGFSFERIRKFFWVNRELAQGNSVIDVLDGLRGMAAVMVIADHTWPRFVGVGASGVLIFFVLSGFLLARPFVTNPEKIRKKGFLLQYGKRRLQRILPMYYLYIVLVFVMSRHLGDAILDAFFLKGDGHLWAVPQEMLFYIIFPWIALLSFILFKGKTFLILPALAMLAICSNLFLGKDVFYLYGMNAQSLPFYLGVFLSGCGCAYLYYGWYEREKTFRDWVSGRLSWVWIIVGVFIVVLFWFFSNGHLLGNSRIFAQQFYGLYGFAAAVLIFSLLVDGSSPLVRVFSWPLFRVTGVVSYSLYLLHPLVLNILVAANVDFFNRHLTGGVLCLLTFIFSLPLAIVTYRYIEQPFLVPRSS